ncbi:NS1 protein [zander parvovirus]|uniref:NS1 protein n=1 Tax=zander parvovirus TaxID=3071220 RepID=A0AA49H0C3_9VIRU|nr:NS1 protein [Parvovirinae sp.]UNJ12755.1 NS1 protein [zander parvovirus]
MSYRISQDGYKCSHYHTFVVQLGNSSDLRHLVNNWSQFHYPETDDYYDSGAVPMKPGGGGWARELYPSEEDLINLRVCGNVMRGILRCHLDPYVPDQVFISLEKGIDHHMHVIIPMMVYKEDGGMSETKVPYILRDVVKNINGNIQEWFSNSGLPFTTKTVQWKRKPNGTHQSVNLLQFIYEYFSKKPTMRATAGGLMGSQTFMGEDLVDEAVAFNLAKKEQLDYTVPKLMASTTTNAQEYKQYLSYCIDNGICTNEGMKADPFCRNLYENKQCNPSGMVWLKKLMEEVANSLSRAHTLAWYITQKFQYELFGTPDCVFTRIWRLNGLNADTVCAMLYKWANHQTGKKNSLVLVGPPSTGKTLLASTLADLSPSTGMVNKNNMNFPFCACDSRTLIWMEEGRLTEEMIDDWKGVTGGTKIRVDKKGVNTQVPIYRTPLVWTTNEDPFMVYSGNSMSVRHQQALSERYIVMPLTKILDGKAWEEIGWTYPTGPEAFAALAACMKWGQLISKGKDIKWWELRQPDPTAVQLCQVCPDQASAISISSIRLVLTQLVLQMLALAEEEEGPVPGTPARVRAPAPDPGSPLGNAELLKRKRPDTPLPTKRRLVPITTPGETTKWEMQTVTPVKEEAEVKEEEPDLSLLQPKEEEEVE